MLKTNFNGINGRKRGRTTNEMCFGKVEEYRLISLSFYITSTEDATQALLSFYYSIHQRSISLYKDPLHIVK